MLLNHIDETDALGVNKESIESTEEHKEANHNEIAKENIAELKCLAEYPCIHMPFHPSIWKTD
jgi:hypothetical protein